MLVVYIANTNETLEALSPEPTSPADVLFRTAKTATPARANPGTVAHRIAPPSVQTRSGCTWGTLITTLVWSSKPVRSGNPRLGRFDSCAAPSDQLCSVPRPSKTLDRHRRSAMMNG